MSEHQNDPKVVQLREQAPQPQQPIVVDPGFFDQVVRETTKQIEARARYVSPFNLNTMDEIVQFAEHTAKSGLCPKAYKDKVNDIISAVIFGKEVGLPAMTSLTSIAVIEGQPQLWGPAVAGLCLQTGKVQDHTYAWEGEPGSADYTAVCTVTRKGMSPIEGRFSQADAIQAGLTSRAKEGMPWKAYARDMLMWKASHRAWQKAFPDVIKGLSGAQPPSEEPGLEGWSMPQPEMRWRAMRPKLDAWDVKWFNDACERLRTAADTREWMVTLAELLGAAPSLRDVDELDSWDMTTTVVGNAPENWRLRVEEVFGEARKRFITTEPPKTETTPDSGTKPQRRRAAAPAASTEPAPPPVTEAVTEPVTEPVTEEATDVGFGYPLLDTTGYPIGEITYDLPVPYAKAFMALWNKTELPLRAALEEQNADGAQDAIKLSEEAAAILSEIEEPPLEVVPLQIERGKPNTIAYLRDIKNDMVTLTNVGFYEWVDLQRPIIAILPASTRLLVIKAIGARALELGIPAPNGWSPGGQAAAPAEPATDKDDKVAEGMIQHLDTLGSEAEINAYSNTAAVKVPLDRWKTERPQLHTAVWSAFHGRLEHVKHAR